MRLRSGLFAFAVVCAATVSHKAEASPLIFTDRATFQSYHALLGLPPLALETFDTNGWTFVIRGLNDPCVRNLNGLKIHSDCHAPGAFQAGNAIFSGEYSGQTAVFDTPQTSIGFDYRVSSGFPCNFSDPADVSCNVVRFGFLGTSFLLSGSGFLGIIDTSNPSIFMVSGGSCAWARDRGMAMDNLLLTRVPEPSTALLFGSAFALLQVVRYRRRSSQSQ